MKWTPRLVVGVPEMDVEHRALLDALDALVAALRSRTPAEVERRLTAFGDAVVVHFGEEERLMGANAYPEYAAHRASHESLGRDFARITADLRRSGFTPAMAGAVQARLGTWLADHIAGADAAFGRWLVARRTAA